VFAKRDPDLAKFYEQEAQPVEIPIFGQNKNQIVFGRLAKDPTTAGLVRLAAQIHENWREQDKTAAEQARAAAEATLKRLDATAVA
jgi:hypothetical protein